MPVSRGCAVLKKGRSGRDRTPEKRKVGGLIPPLTTPQQSSCGNAISRAETCFYGWQGPLPVFIHSVSGPDRRCPFAVARRVHVPRARHKIGAMPRSVVGLLAALGVVLSSLLALMHGDLTPLVVLGAGTATGLASYLALPSSKKNQCQT